MNGTVKLVMETAVLHYPLNDPAETVNEMGSSVRRVMGGTSGILYDIFFKSAYAHLKAAGKSDLTLLHWAGALEAAIANVSKYGGASAGYRTLLDALIPASSTLKERLAAGDNPVDAFARSAESAVAGAESTKNMKAQAGCSSYVSEEMSSYIGVMAAAAWHKAAASSVKGKNRHKAVIGPIGRRRMQMQ